MDNQSDYSQYYTFIDKFKNTGFANINRNDPLVNEIEEKLLKHKQFFYVADLLKLKMVYVSQSCLQSLGIPASDFEPGINFDITHPDDVQRHTVGRSRLIKLGHETFEKGDDFAFMSTNLRFRHKAGHYINFLIQLYFFSVNEPVHNVFVFGLHSDINWFGPIKHGYHHYLGKDLSYFRLPDEELILTGCVFTDREFEILSLIKYGMDSADIGKKLYISPHTVDTHRRNILKKTGFHHCTELVIDLQEQGYF